MFIFAISTIETPFLQRLHAVCGRGFAVKPNE
jgi:hypothetical protein